MGLSPTSSHGSGTGSSSKIYLSKPAANITRAAATIGAFSTAWQITGVAVAAGQNVYLKVNAMHGASSPNNDRMFAVLRGATQLTSWGILNPGAGGATENGPAGAMEWIDENPGAGTYTYEVQAAMFIGGTLTVYQTNPTTDVLGGGSIFVAEVYTP